MEMRPMEKKNIRVGGKNYLSKLIPHCRDHNMDQVQIYIYMAPKTEVIIRVPMNKFKSKMYKWMKFNKFWGGCLML